MLQYLTVKVMIPQHVQFEIYKCIRFKFFNNGQQSKEKDDLLNKALDEAWSKKRNFVIRIRFHNV